jgi:CheY-like chemotaxis protein
MTSLRPKPGLPDEEVDQAKSEREVPAQASPSRVPAKEERAFSDFLSKGAEEIQDHLSLVARIQVQIGRLLETSIEELERAQRLETLTSLIAGGEAESDPPLGEGDPAPSGSGEKPAAYLDREIRTLKKMQKLLGLRTGADGAEGGAAADGSNAGAHDEAGPELDVARRILIIFHDPGTVRILRYFLEKEDYDVLVCSNGPDGLQKAVDERPDLILLDILLSGMDGYQVLGRLRKNARTAGIPVFVMSHLAQEADILKAIEGGAADYFTKPFSPHIIIAKIRRALRARHE